jgi:hypothetical protein
VARSSAIVFAILSERSFLGLGKGYITKEALDSEKVTSPKIL